MAMEMKAIRKLKQSLPQSRISYGLAVGFFFVLLTYLAMSEQFAIRAPNAVSKPTSGYETNTSPTTEEKKSSSETELEEKTEESKPNPKSDPVKKEEVIRLQEDAAKQTQPFGDERKSEEITHKDDDFRQFGGGAENLNQSPAKKPICDVNDPRSDVCDIVGDVRAHGISSTIMLVPVNPGPNPDPHEWKIRPYSRKNMDGIKHMTVKTLNGPHEAPPCTIRENIPAVVFALGGHTGNYWHDFTDVIIPLFLASRQFDGEVQFLVTNIQGWWVGKYRMILNKLSRYEMIDFDKDGAVRCYPHAVVGIKIHKEFSIDPSKAPNGYSMFDFRKFMRTTYSLPRDYPIRLSDNKKPRLLLIARGLSRRFTNVPEIANSAEKLGYEVVVIDAKFDVNIAEFSKIVNSADVLVGVHGAGLTNCVFLPPNAVMIQIVPYGNIEFIAKLDFGDPAADMDIQYLEYSISAEESTLMDMFGKDHPIIKDPDSIHRSGWQKVGEFYLGKQDVKLDVNRFAPTLLKAKELLRG